MHEVIKSHVFGREIQVGDESARGGRGIIWKTDERWLLLKQFAPELIVDDPGRQQVLREKAERAYVAFCAVNRGQQEELSSLPLEYVTVGDNPAYLMRRAEGVPLQRILRERLIAESKRLPIAHALARALRKLHEAQIIHADTHPDNYFVREDPGGFTVIVLDIDDGGLLSPPGPVYPSVQPYRLYKAPELSQMKWEQLFRRHLFFAPDDWALAVLVYQLLVDYEGPFCTVKTHPNPAVTNYTPYPQAAYRERSIGWPKPWQEQLLQSAGLSDGIVSLFYATFADRFLLPEKPGGTPRTRAAARVWEEALAPQRAHRPVLTVYALKTARAPVRSDPPLPVTLHEAVPRMPVAPHQPSVAPEILQTLPEARPVLPAGDPIPAPPSFDEIPGPCVEMKRDEGLWVRRGDFGLRTAVTIILRKLHLRRRGGSGNGRSAKKAAA
jgi:serine/threonine protein kinase